MSDDSAEEVRAAAATELSASDAGSRLIRSLDSLDDFVAGLELGRSSGFRGVANEAAVSLRGAGRPGASLYVDSPVVFYLDYLRNRSLAAKLVRRHGESAVREVLAGLGEVAGFPPANLLWNANHWDVPLHCFFRTKREPVFRVVRLETERTRASVSVEHGSPRRGAAVREVFQLRRNWSGVMVVETREVLG